MSGALASRTHLTRVTVASKVLVNSDRLKIECPINTALSGFSVGASLQKASQLDM